MRVRRAAEHLVGEPAVVEVGEQRIAVGGEHARVGLLLRVDALLQPGRAVIRVDEAVDVLAEAQPELEVALGGRHGAASKSAAWP